MNLKEMKALYKKANAAYNNGGTVIMTDAEFDKLEAKIRKLDPEWSHLRKTGATVGKKVAVKLPRFMPSLSKCYPETLDKWTAKQKAKIMLWLYKLDGSALLGRYLNGRCVFLATRGDGTTGKDISFLIPHLNLPILKGKTEVILRFEALMKAKVFKKKWLRKSEDDKDGFDNARNAVNGLLNRTKVHAAMKDIDLVVLGVYGYQMEDGLDWADRQGFITAPRGRVALKSDYEALLEKARAESPYDIDGLVLVPPTQVFDYDNADRPKWTTAFKVNDVSGADEAVVEDIIWQISRTDRWTPKIKIKPVVIGGAKVTYATAHNAQWMNDRRIGVGAVIKIVRSGDVIPKIVDVVKPAKVPSHPPGEFYEKGVHYYATARSKDSDVREILHFFTVLGIENLARKGVDKLYDGGFTSVLDHLNSYGVLMKGYEDAGIGKAITAKIYAECSRVFQTEGVTMLKLMNASNCFESFGERKLAMIENHFIKRGDKDPLAVMARMNPSQLARTRANALAKEKGSKASTNIKGIAFTSLEQFFDGLGRFIVWFADIKKTKLIKLNAPAVPAKKKAVTGDLSGQLVSFTGYRSPEHEAAVAARGAEVIGYSSKTTILLYKAGGKTSGKIQAAKDKGLKVCTYEELK